jgi:hypothetical protein
MYVGKTLFAQVMDFLPWKTFHCIVSRYGGDHRVRTLTCAEQLRCIAFAQLTITRACATSRRASRRRRPSSPERVPGLVENWRSGCLCNGVR